MDLVDRLSRRLFRQATIIDKQPLADQAIRFTIQGNDLRNLNYTPGEHLRVLVGFGQLTALRDKVRTYSIWHYDRLNATIELAVCTHSTGVGSRWAAQAAVGDTLYFGGPKGKFTVDASGDFYVFIGDMSALAHLYELRRNLSSPKPIISVVYADQQTHYFPDLDGSHPFDFYQMHANPGDAIIEQLTPLLGQLSGKGIVYVGGDGRLCVSLNRYFRDTLGWSSQQVKTKPFWLPNKTGLE